MRANGTAYFVMEYVQGVTLEAHFGRFLGRPSYDELRQVMRQLLDGLHCLHERKLLHRDLKPENMLMERQRLVIIDLGVAKTSVPYSVTGEAFCTPGYTPFEQYQTRGNMGPWTDLYAVGATLHKILTGEAPPEALKRLDHDPYVPLAHRLAEHYPRRFLQAIDRALAMEVRDRPASIAHWRRLMGEEHVVGEAPLTGFFTFRSLDNPSLNWRYLALAGLLILVAVLVWYFSSSN
jgi:serine/threonine protein kinase